MPIPTLPSVPACSNLPAVPSSIRLRFPFGIQLESPRTSLGIVSLDELLAPQLSAINQMLAPFTPILSLAGIVTALINFAKSVPDAISQLSPSPIINALEDLAEKAQLLPQFIPGVPYIILIRDILGLMRQVLQALRDLLLSLVTTLDNADAALDGTEGMDASAVETVQAYVACSIEDAMRQWESAVAAMTPLNVVLCALVIPLQILETFLPSSARETVKNFRCSFSLLSTPPTITVGADVSETILSFREALSDFDEVLETLITLIYELERVFARIIGEDVNSTVAVVDCFSDCP